MKTLAYLAAAAALAACSPLPQEPAPPRAAEAPAPMEVNAPAGAYSLDKTHASLTFTVSHLGFSNYTMAFERFDAALQFDPANIPGMSVTASVDATSLDLPAPPAGFLEEVLGAQFLDTAQYPEIAFRSTSVEQTGPATARVTGDLTLHGQTKPITLEATFNGGYPGMAGFDPNARIGFSAHGRFNRSDFGISYGLPAPGTTMGVGDEVHVMIEAEFTGPPLPAAEAPAAPPAEAPAQ